MTICYCAIARRDRKGLRTKGSFTVEQGQEEDKGQHYCFQTVVEGLLSTRPERHYCTVKKLENKLWFYAKEVKGWAYTVITSPDYPEEAAYECVDELSTRNYKFSLKNKRRRYLKRNCVCHITAIKYSDLSIGGVIWQLTKEMDETVLSEYKKSVQTYIKARQREERKKEMDKLEQDVATLKEKMATTIQESLQKTEKLQDLSVMAEETLQKAMVFKKKAVELKEKVSRNEWKKKKQIVTCSTIAFAAVGGTCTFLAGGATAPVFFTVMANELLAQAMESVLVGAIAGSMGYYSSQAATDTYFWGQKFIVV